jgi:hypothetical protein
MAEGLAGRGADSKHFDVTRNPSVNDERKDAVPARTLNSLSRGASVIRIVYQK